MENADRRQSLNCLVTLFKNSQNAFQKCHFGDFLKFANSEFLIKFLSKVDQITQFFWSKQHFWHSIFEKECFYKNFLQQSKQPFSANQAHGYQSLLTFSVLTYVPLVYSLLSEGVSKGSPSDFRFFTLISILAPFVSLAVGNLLI